MYSYPFHQHYVHECHQANVSNFPSPHRTPSPMRRAYGQCLSWRISTKFHTSRRLGMFGMHNSRPTWLFPVPSCPSCGFGSGVQRLARHWNLFSTWPSVTKTLYCSAPTGRCNRSSCPCNLTWPDKRRLMPSCCWTGSCERCPCHMSKFTFMGVRYPFGCCNMSPFAQRSSTSTIVLHFVSRAWSVSAFFIYLTVQLWKTSYILALSKRNCWISLEALKLRKDDTVLKSVLQSVAIHIGLEKMVWNISKTCGL